jgi:hypothetical protein
MAPMTEREASDILAETDADLIPLVQGRLPDVKKLWRACLERDLPVAVASPPGRT